MFKDRKIEIGLVKKTEVPTMGVINKNDDKKFEERVELVHIKVDKTIGKVMLGVGAYVILDTWRKVLIAKAGS